MSEFRFPPIKVPRVDFEGKRAAEPSNARIRAAGPLIPCVAKMCSCKEPSRSATVLPFLGPTNSLNVNPFGQNKPPFHGILGTRDWTNPKRIPRDNRVRVTSNTVEPYTLMVRFVAKDVNNNDYVSGTGALIGPRHVLTAAHVVYGIHGGNYLTPVRIQRWGDAQEYTHKNIYVPAEFIAQVQQKKFDNIALGSPTFFAMFCLNDYALIITTSDMVDPDSNFFQYNYSTNQTWWAGRQFQTFGFPSNLFNNANPNGLPCFDIEPLQPNLFNGMPFGRCDGHLYEETVKFQGGGFVGEAAVQVYFDLGIGQSGSPIVYKSNGLRTIYGVNSLAGSLGNYAHKLNVKSVSDLDMWMDENPF